MLETVAWGAKLLTDPPCFSSCALFVWNYSHRGMTSGTAIPDSSHQGTWEQREAEYCKQDSLRRFLCTPSVCDLFVKVAKKVGVGGWRVRGGEVHVVMLLKRTCLLRPYPWLRCSFFDSSHTAAQWRARSWTFREPIRKCFRRKASDNTSLGD